MNRPLRYFMLSLVCLLSCLQKLRAQSISPAQLDTLAEKAMRTFNVPGISIAIVKDGKVVTAKGYGVRSIISRLPVDEHTLFGIASNSKAFTAAALGILVSEGKISWDDKVTKYIPEFKMYDPYVTAEFTIRDMLTHRSGLGLGAGDLMHNPDSSNFTIKDIIYSLRYLKPEASFRSRYAYDNIFYLIAGELIARVSGMNWGNFIEKRIMQPLQMSSSGASYRRVKSNADIIDGHKEVNGNLEIIVRTDVEIDAGAGGIYSNAVDMSKWMLMQLNNGKYGTNLNKQLFSESVHKEMWTPQVIIPASKYGVYNTHFGAYGLGWFLTDVKGVEQISHTGQDDGMISEVSLIPELQLGITVLSNQEGGGAVRAIIEQVTDNYLSIPGTDRIKQWADKVKAVSASGNQATTALWDKAKQHQFVVSKSISRIYTGNYHDNWFGNVQISLKNNRLWFQSARSPQLRGPMLFYKDHTFIAQWLNPQVKADALVTFNLDHNGKAGRISMKRASPETSFAFDFQDLDFRRIDNKSK